MVKGISRQVIMVHSPDPKLFEQAIFILKDEAIAEGISDEALIKEAEQAVRERPHKKPQLYAYGAFWASAGAAAMGLVWLVTALI